MSLGKGRVVAWREDDRTRHDKLQLADGRLAIDLRLGELRAELADLGITAPPTANKDQLLDLYAESKGQP